MTTLKKFSGASLIQYLHDIRFWIFLFFVLRLYGITLPPLEVAHNWRQTDGLMIARNFYEVDSNILYPRVDVAGNRTGIVGCEFPLLNYVIYVLAKIFGYQHWYGRLVVLFVSSLGVYYFYRLIQEKFGENAGFNSAIILLVSLWFSFSRKIIPDTLAASLAIIALYSAFKFLNSERGLWFLLFVCFALLACLIKILAATILTVLAIPMLNRSIDIKKKLMVALAAFVVLLGTCAWYFVWVPHLNSTYGMEGHFFMGYPFDEGLKLIAQDFPIVLKRFYDTPLKYSGFACFLLGLFFVVRKKIWLALLTFLFPFIFFVVLLIKTGNSIVHDHYYMLTIIPAMAFIAGFGLTFLPPGIAKLILVLVAIEGVANQAHDFRIRQPYKAFQDLETIMDSVSDRRELILINTDFDDPMPMYFAHRRGWNINNQMLSDPQLVDDLIKQGAKYLVIVRKLHGDISLNFTEVYRSEYFKIYKLDHGL